MVGSAGLVADFYSEPELTNVIRVLALGSIAQGFQNIGVVAFRSEMRFDREFLFMTSKRLIAIGTTIPLVFMLDSYWALVIGQTTGKLALRRGPRPSVPRCTRC
jgi:O-antigen/teichoic acid export membrane protein